MKYLHIVAILAIVQYLVFGMLVGRARQRYGVRAPATTGHEQFERAYRVQMNTLEQIICFLPALFLAAIYWPQEVVAPIGAIYLVGRQLYRNAYVKDPRSRGIGFLLSLAPTVILLVMATWGALLRAAT